MSISAKDVKILRDRTGAGMMDCKKALMDTGGNLEEAIDLMRASGAAKAAKRAGKVAGEGTIGTYLHFDNRVASMVELNCETDFVANTDDFKGLAREIALHIASQAPVVSVIKTYHPIWWIGKKRFMRNRLKKKASQTTLQTK